MTQKVHHSVTKVSTKPLILQAMKTNHYEPGTRTTILSSGIARLDAFEGRLCLPCNNIARVRPVKAYFSAVSRLGDGMIWYVMLAVLPIAFGKAAYIPVLQMSVTALAGVVFYKAIKGFVMRERPFASHANLSAVTAPLDRFSFPSGHTLQATMFLVLLMQYFPTIALLMLPFVISVAASRVILGLHYPSDVVIGTLLGWALAATSISIASL